MTPFAAGVLNGALYLAAVFIAGLWVRNPVAWKLAIAAMGLTFLCYFVQCVNEGRVWAMLASYLSIAVGIAAGLALLF